jgi:triosephosphate isomerase
MARRRLVVGNWKMHGLGEDLAEAAAIAKGARACPGVDVGLCVPATLIERAARMLPGFPIGGQDLHQGDKGAHTGCVCAAMLLDAGATMTIIGHSERREAQRESDSEVRAKSEAALRSGLGVILCVGESLGVREAGEAPSTVGRQLDSSLPSDCDIAGLAIAYEPIWAIGTGRTATCEDIAAMHETLRRRLVAAFGPAGEGVRILYGGSVKAANAAEIFAVDDVDGALVGGASLKAADFLPIVEAAASAG